MEYFSSGFLADRWTLQDIYSKSWESKLFQWLEKNIRSKNNRLVGTVEKNE
jgi:hypothetical protein